jgi:uncharacterized membrane protein YkvA (DUF1232 family)
MVTARRATALRAAWDAVRGASGRDGHGVGERLRALPRMLRLGLSGRYPHLDRGRMAMVGLGLIYVISPFDLVPEVFVPLLGLGDDALVATWLAGAVLSETDAFLNWEREDSRVVPGEVVD